MTIDGDQFDYSRYRYERELEAKARRRLAREAGHAPKEIRAGALAAELDLERKISQARQLLASGERVRVCVRLLDGDRDRGAAVLDRIIASLADASEVSDGPVKSATVVAAVLRPI